MSALQKGVMLLAVAVFLFFAYTRVHLLQQVRYPLRYSEGIQRYASEYQVNTHLVAAVIFAESLFRPDALSRRDARGLMQILPSTGAWAAERMGLDDFSAEKLFEPALNIRIGTWYLSSLARQFGADLHNPGPELSPEVLVVLAAYNGGSGNVTKWLNDTDLSEDGITLDHIPFYETREYVAKVQRAYQMYRKLYPELMSFGKQERNGQNEE